MEAFASGSFGQIFRAEFEGRIVAVKRYKVRYIHVHFALNLLNH